MTGAFTLMEFAEFKPVAYLESETCSLFLERPDEITAYRRILTALADAVLDEGESSELSATLQPSSPRIERTMMTAPELNGIVWHTSSYSGAHGGCVEVASTADRVLVRDSKDPDSPALTFPTSSWRTFRTAHRGSA